MQSLIDLNFIKRNVVIFISVLILFFGISWNVSLYDEGIILTGAQQVSEGKMIHREFKANYGPGQFYLVAASYRVFGESVLAERIVDWIEKMLIVILSCLLLSRWLTRSSVHLWSLFLASWLAYLGAPCYPVWPCLVLMLLGITLIKSSTTHGFKSDSLINAGLCTGAIVLFRYDLALLVMCAYIGVFTIVAFNLLEQNTNNRPISHAFKPTFQWNAALIAGAVIPLGVLVAWLILNQADKDWFFQVIDYATNHYPATRSLPFPSLIGGLKPLPEYTVYLPMFLPLWIFLSCLYLKSKNKTLFISNIRDSILGVNPQASVDLLGLVRLLLLLAFCLLLSVKGFIRVSVLHFSLSLVPAFILLYISWFRSHHDLRQHHLINALKWLLLSLAIGSTIVITGKTLKTSFKNFGTIIRCFHSSSKNLKPNPPEVSSYDEHVPLEDGFKVDSIFKVPDDTIKAGRELKRIVTPHEMIYVGLNRHDRIYVNDNLTYFMTKLKPATRWYHFDPGQQNLVPIQTEMISELERNGVKVIVLTSRWDENNEPNESTQSTGVTLLDEFIRKRYRVTWSYGTYQILQRIE